MPLGLSRAFFALMLLIGSLSAPAQAPALSISLSAPTVELISGTCLEVEATVTNVSERTAYVFGFPPGATDLRGQGNRAFDVVVSHARGRLAPQTAYVRWSQHKGYWGSSIAVPLAPGQSLHTKITVSKFFDLTVPGTYWVQVSLKQRNPSSAKSNRLKITVPNAG